MTKYQLMSALFSGLPCSVTSSSGLKLYGVVQMVEREDGSGKSFNVRIYNPNWVNDKYEPLASTRMIHVRTID